MRSRAPRVVVAGLAGSLRGDCRVAVVAHPALRGDRRDSLELRVGAADGGADLAEREAQVTGGRHSSHPVDGSHGNDLALTRIEVGHQVSRAGHAIRQLGRLERSTKRGRTRHGSIEIDPLTRAQAREMPALTVPAATVIDRKPKGAQEVLLVRSTVRRHHDGRDRVVHDLLLRASRNAAGLAAPAQLPDQLSATLV
jgi:hypothetical protein